MAAAATSARSKLAAALAAMERKYGVTKVIGGGASLEQCLFLTLRQGWDFKKASRAVRILQSRFIDWNEVRVSSAAELCEELAALGCSADMMSRLKRMKGFLDAVMNALNDLDGEILRSMDFEPLRRLLLGIEQLGRANAYVFLQCYIEDPKKKEGGGGGERGDLVVSPESMRVAIRLGIIGKTQSPNKARKEFMALLKPSGYLRFQYLTARHAETFCTSKNLLCGNCFLKRSCPFPGGN